MSIGGVKRSNLPRKRNKSLHPEGKKKEKEVFGGEGKLFTSDLRREKNPFSWWPRGATVARLTPDEKVMCSSHVGVSLFCRFGEKC